MHGVRPELKMRKDYGDKPDEVYANAQAEVMDGWLRSIVYSCHFFGPTTTRLFGVLSAAGFVVYDEESFLLYSAK